MWQIDIPATCNAGGVGKWGDGLNAHFRDANVVIVNDNDQAGRDHADAVAAKLSGIAARVRRLDLALHWSGMSDKADISDWLEQGHSREELDALIAAAPDYQPQSSKSDSRRSEDRLGRRDRLRFHLP